MGNVAPKTIKQTENIVMTDGHKRFPREPHVGQLLCMGLVGTPRASVETLDKSWISCLCWQLDHNCSIFRPAA